MKKIITISFSFLLSSTFLAQITCCSKFGNSFAMLTKDKEFILSHIEPEPFVLKSQSGKDITFKTPAGKQGYAYVIKAEKPTDNYIFVFHEWWGLNDYVKQESENISKTIGNVNVIAIDLYNKKVATDRDSAAKYMNAVNTQDAEDVIKGALNYAGKKAHIATIGWCFGGGWSLQAALLSGKQAQACVMYYGMPEEKKEKLKNLNAPVLFIFAEQDKWINKEVVSKFEANMKEANKKLEVKSYDAVHGFANPSNPKYAKAFADEAFKTATDFIKTNLK